MVAKIEPHGLNLKTHVTSHVAISSQNLCSLHLREGLQLEAGLSEKRNRALKEVVPEVVLKIDGEVVSDGVREVSEGSEDHRVDQHGHLGPVRGIDGVLDQVLEHEKHLHHKVQQVLPASFFLRPEVMDILGVVVGSHQSKHGDHIGDHCRGIPVNFASRSNTLNDSS